jgi:hypothetical protein
MAIDSKTMENGILPVNQLLPEPINYPIRPEPREMDRLDGALRLCALFLMLLASCFIFDHIGHASSAGSHAFLAYALFLFGVSLLFMSVMVARSPLVAAFADLIVKFIHKFVFGDA